MLVVPSSPPAAVCAAAGARLVAAAPASAQVVSAAPLGELVRAGCSASPQVADSPLDDYSAALAPADLAAPELPQPDADSAAADWVDSAGWQAVWEWAVPAWQHSAGSRVEPDGPWRASPVSPEAPA